MAKTVLGLYERMDQAESAIQDLIGEGFSHNAIRLKTGDEIIDEVGRQETDAEAGFMGGLRSFLKDIGLMSGERAHEYEVRGIEAADAMVLVEEADDVRADRAADILNRHGAIDIEERAARAGTARPAAPGGTEAQRIPAVEEQLKVGTRPVTRGGVRIYTQPTERIAEQQVRLKEEKAHVERHAVDRPVRAGEHPFEERSYEVRETGEEPVIAKEARVKEEVTVGKAMGEREETVRETLRGTEVKIEPLPPEEAREFTTHEREFRSDYESSFASRGMRYEDVEPVYRYGYHKGRDPELKRGDWPEVEPKIRRDWEAHRYGPWDRYEDAVRAGWERAHRR